MNQFNRTRKHRDKSKQVVLAGMMGAVMGAIICAGAAIVWNGPAGLEVALPIVLAEAAMCAFGGAIVGGALGAGVVFVVS